MVKVTSWGVIMTLDQIDHVLRSRNSFIATLYSQNILPPQIIEKWTIWKLGKRF